MNKIRRFLSTLCAVCMLFSMATPAFATDLSITSPYSLSTTEADGVRTAVTRDDTTEYIVVYDTINETVQYSERNLQTGIVTSGDAVKVNNYQSISSRSTISLNTNSGFEYTEWTGRQNEWELERPKTQKEGSGRYYFKLYENNSNTNQVRSFKNEVNTLSNKEAEFKNLTTLALLSSLGAGVISGFAVATAGLLTDAAIAAIVAATGASGTAAVAGKAVGTQCNNCMIAIEDVWHSTDNTHS